MKLNVIFSGVHGSHLYGTNTETSDHDYKSIFIPSAREIVMASGPTHYTDNTNNVRGQKNSAEDVDNEFFSLKYFIELAKKGETFVIDMLHTPAGCNLVGDNETWNFIQQNRHRFYTTDMKAYLGYVRKQAGKYGVKGTRLAALRKVKEHSEILSESRVKTREEFDTELSSQINKGITKHISSVVVLRIRDFIETMPILDGFTSIFKDDKGNRFYEVLGRKYQDTMSIEEFKQKINGVWKEYGERARKAEANEGIDWKAMHHACRGGIQLLEIYRTGDLKYPLYDAAFLKSIKEGKEPFKIVQEYLEDTVANVEKACNIARKNGMPEKVEPKFWDDFVHDVYLTEIFKHYESK